jgi:hypothetical protein
MNTGPSASSAASATLAVTSTPTVPTSSISPDIHNRPCGVNMPPPGVAPLAVAPAAVTTPVGDCLLVSAIAWKIASSLSAKAALAEPCVPASKVASWSGAPVASVQITF